MSDREYRMVRDAQGSGVVPLEDVFETPEGHIVIVTRYVPSVPIQSGSDFHLYMRTLLQVRTGSLM